MTAECKWCGAEYPDKEGKKFCTPAHKDLFNNAARKWGLQAAHAGLVSVDTLKALSATSGPCTANKPRLDATSRL